MRVRRASPATRACSDRAEDTRHELFQFFSAAEECIGSTWWSRCTCDRSSRTATCVICGLLTWLVAVPLTFAVGYLCTLAYALLYAMPWWLCMAATGSLPSHCSWTEENAELHESECIQEIYPEGTRSEWIDLQPRKGATNLFSTTAWQAHRLMIPYTGKENNPQHLIVIHGSNSAATLMMSSCAGLLSQHYALHCIDLPGYGRTTLPTGMSRDDAKDLSGPELVTMYCEFLERYCRTCRMQRPVVVSHSAGAFFTLMWADCYRDRASLGGVVLVSMAGCLPTFNMAAAHFAVGFLLEMPQTFVRSLGVLGAWIMQPLVNGSALKRYWQVESTPAYTSFDLDSISVRFILAADKTGRVALVVGSTDILASHSEHLFLADLAAKLGIYLPCFSIEGGGHILFHHDEGRSIVDAISAALAALKNRGYERRRGESRLAEFEERLRQTTWQLTYSSFDVLTTRARRHQLYALLSSLAAGQQVDGAVAGTESKGRDTTAAVLAKKGARPSSLVVCLSPGSTRAGPASAGGGRDRARDGAGHRRGRS